MQKFVIDGRLPSLNEYIYACKISRGKWNKGYQMKKDCQDLIKRHISEFNLKPIDYPIDIEYMFYEPNKRRDKDNISGVARKFINDALQESKIIPNDNWSYVNKLTDNYSIDKEYPRIEVFLKRSK